MRKVLVRLALGLDLRAEQTRENEPSVAERAQLDELELESWTSRRTLGREILTPLSTTVSLTLSATPSPLRKLAPPLLGGVLAPAPPPAPSSRELALLSGLCGAPCCSRSLPCSFSRAGSNSLGARPPPRENRRRNPPPFLRPTEPEPVVLVLSADDALEKPRAWSGGAPDPGRVRAVEVEVGAGAGGRPSPTPALEAGPGASSRSLSCGGLSLHGASSSFTTRAVPAAPGRTVPAVSSLSLRRSVARRASTTRTASVSESRRAMACSVSGWSVPEVDAAANAAEAAVGAEASARGGDEVGAVEEGESGKEGVVEGSGVEGAEGAGVSLTSEGPSVAVGGKVEIGRAAGRARASGGVVEAEGEVGVREEVGEDVRVRRRARR